MTAKDALDALAAAARDLRKARRHLARAIAAAEQAAKDAHAQGVAETVIARTLEVNRMTVRRWLGKLR